MRPLLHARQHGRERDGEEGWEEIMTYLAPVALGLTTSGEKKCYHVNVLVFLLALFHLSLKVFIILSLFVWTLSELDLLTYNSDI